MLALAMDEARDAVTAVAINTSKKRAVKEALLRECGRTLRAAFPTGVSGNGTMAASATLREVSSGSACVREH